MASKKIVRTEFKAEGNLDKKFSLMDRAAARFGRSAEKSFRRANRGASRFSSVTKGVVAGLGISRGLGLLTQGIGSVVTDFIAFDKAALGATVRFKDVSSGASDFNEVLKLTRKTAREMGAETEFTAAQNAEALNFLAKAGWDSAAAFGGLRSMVDLATATGEDFERVADISSDLLGAFGLAADNTADKIKNLNRVNDILVKTSNSANVTVENMFDTMKQVGPVSGILSASIEEVATLTGVLGNAGIKGTDAMTALKNAYLRLAAPVGSGAKVLKALNITLDDGNGGAKSMTSLMEEMGKKMEGLGKIPRAKFMEAIFGKFAIAGGVTLQNNIKNIKEFRKEVDAAGDTSRKTAEIMRTSIDAKLKTLGSSATEVGFKILEAFQVDGKNGIDALTEAIRNFDAKPLTEGLGITLDAIKLVINAAGKAFSLLVKIGRFEGEAAAKIVNTLMGGEDPTQAYKTAVAQAQVEAAGFGVDLRDKETKRVPLPGPNQKEAAAKAFPGFQGQLNIAGAPEGSTMETKSAPPGFSVSMLGQN